VYQNKNDIHSIKQIREPSTSHHYNIPTIDFMTKDRLIHEDLGAFPYTHNLFIDLNTSMKVQKAGVYTFIVASDDGFELYIDKKILASFPKDRSMAADTVRVFLDKGTHLFSLYYFQGGGDMGLRAYYVSSEKGSQRFLIGEESSYIEFRK
jgi:hypothetical protein